MLSLKYKDLKNRTLYLNNEKQVIINHFLFIHFLHKLKKKNLIFIFLKKNKSSKLKYRVRTKLNRRCAISNRNRGIYRSYGLSRFFLRDFMQFGILPGFKKAVW